MDWVIFAAFSDFAVSALHLVIIFSLGPQGYRMFGAGEKFATMVEEGKLYPHIVTFGIAVVFALFGFYTLSSGHYIERLPYANAVVVIIASIYTLRGLAGIPTLFTGYTNKILMIWSSIVSFVFGVFHFLALI